MGITQGPCPESQPADVLGRSGASFLLSLVEPRCLVPFGVCFGGKRDKKGPEGPRLLPGASPRGRGLASDAPRAQHRPPGHSLEQSRVGLCPCSCVGWEDAVRSRAMLPPPPAPWPLPSQCSSSPKSPPRLLRAFHPRMGTFGMGRRATAGAGAGQSVPRLSPTIVPSRQFLSGGSVRSVRSCPMARASTRCLPVGLFPVSRQNLLGPSIQLEGRNQGFWESQP